MADEQFQAWNHFVPRLYLKRFAFSPGLIYHYPLLVSHASVPEWNRLAISKAAARSHLYTFAEDSSETDEVERWFAREFDDPAEEAIERAVTGIQMRPEHWRYLARFFGAQHVRTPANYLKSQNRWKTEIPVQMDQILEDVRIEIERAKEQGIRIEQGKATLNSQMFPMRSVISDSAEPGKSALRIEVTAGRKLWIWELKHSLRLGGPLQLLEGHRWTILTAPEGRSWFTSDHPAIQMGLGSDGQRNLGGGWGALGTVLMLPLNPEHMLYTEIGAKSPEKYSVVSVPKFLEMRRIIADNALRSIFASWRDPLVSELRPRRVDAVTFQNEEQQWRDWPAQQTSAERFEK